MAELAGFDPAPSSARTERRAAFLTGRVDDLLERIRAGPKLARRDTRPLTELNRCRRFVGGTALEVGT